MSAQPVDVLAVRNPFRDSLMRLAFAELVDAYNKRSKLLFHDGQPIRSNSAGVMFWRGYEGVSIGVWDRASRETFAYAHWKAGCAIRAALARVQGGAA